MANRPSTVENGNASVKFPVVGIGASAGGLDAFKKLLAAMPPAPGMAFVLVPHLDPNHKSSMVDLLTKQTSMHIAEVSEGMVLEANCVYIIPPNHYMAISNSHFQLSPPPMNGGMQTAIDFFLRTLAEDIGERSIGIILSGTGSHGTLGIREIKRCGGMAIAQTPESAEFPQMPQSVIDAGLADFILPPESMSEALIKLVGHPYLQKVEDAAVSVNDHLEQLTPVINLLRDRTKYDFRNYRSNMLMRRIERRMGIAQIGEFPTYLEFLNSEPEEINALCRDFLIGVTAFFREPEAYKAMESETIPKLLETHPVELPVRVWVPSCATGEEAYSIAMIFYEAFEAAKKPLRLQMFASDINKLSIEIARKGIYPASIASDIAPERLEKFFITSDGDKYLVKKELRESIVFSIQNLIYDAPFSKIDLISCRNLLIYLEPEMQQKIIALFHFALCANGTLILGPSETLGKLESIFETTSKKWRIFRRRGTTRHDLVTIPIARTDQQPRTSSTEETGAAPKKNYKELTEKIILTEYSPAAVLINHRYEVLYVTGPVVNYLEFPTGELSKDLLVIAREGLRSRLHSTCQKSIIENTTVSDLQTQVKRSGKYHPCSITVRPVVPTSSKEKYLLVTFQERSLPTSLNVVGGNQSVSNNKETESTSSQTQSSELVERLELDLKLAGEELHSTIEEMESSNEELKASNEEIMSMNEELQSANEELESSKEELQSLNEELNTVNGQLQEKISLLDKSNSDMINLMTSTEIATIFLDKGLLIKRFTSTTTQLLNLVSTDIGRPLRDFSPRFSDTSMMSECQQVLDKLTPIEKEVTTEDKRCFLRRILPYMATNKEVDGVVITFLDLTQRKLSEAARRESSDRMRAILNTASDAIITINQSGIMDSVNDATEKMFGYIRSEMIGMNVSMLMPLPYSKEHDEYINRYLQTGESRMLGFSREVTCKRKDGSIFPADLAVSQVDHLGLFTGILRDISNRKEMQKHILESAVNEQRRFGQELHDGTQQELTGLSLFASSIVDTIQLAKNVLISNGLVSGTHWQFENDQYERLVRSADILSKSLVIANQHVRELAHGIMPVQIDAEGLRSALSELVSSMNSHDSIECRFECDSPVNIMNNTTASHLYRIAQEATNNAIRHGQADKITISLTQHSSEITLSVSDNGKGFDVNVPLIGGTASHGMGLRTMEYRANLIGGTLQIKQIANGGTQVTCVVTEESVVR